MVEVEKNIYKGVLNIGFRPTVSAEQGKKSIEVHIMDFNQLLYNKKITVFFRERIREELRFPGLEELKIQLEKDRSNALKILENE